MPSSVRFEYIHVRRIAGAKGISQRVVMEHSKPQQLVNNNPSNRKLITSVLGDPPDAPPAGSLLTKTQGLELHPISLDIKEVILLKNFFWSFFLMQMIYSNPSRSKI